MNIIKKKHDEVVKKDVQMEITVTEIKNHFDYKSVFTHTAIFLALYLLMSIAENSDAIQTFIESNVGAEGSVVILWVASTFIKKLIDAAISYLSNKK